MAIDLADEPIPTPVAATDVVRFDELAGADLIVAPRERNSRMAFDLAHGAVGQRARVTPFFVFAKAHPGGGRAVRFLGLAVPGGQEVHPSDNLVAVWRTSGALRFQNYRATFTILNEGSITRAWVEELSAGVTPGPSCPARYRKWVETGTYDALEAPRNIQYRTKSNSSRERRKMPRWSSETASGWSGPSRPNCTRSENSVGVRDTARLISRLRHREFGVFVTTSFLSKQAYEELRGTGIP
jgi:hypothetical protein